MHLAKDCGEHWLPELLMPERDETQKNSVENEIQLTAAIRRMRASIASRILCTKASSHCRDADQWQARRDRTQCL
jgi:hypothetical protein